MCAWVKRVINAPIKFYEFDIELRHHRQFVTINAHGRFPATGCQISKEKR